jgi:hypothetical protein
VLDEGDMQEIVSNLNIKEKIAKKPEDEIVEEFTNLQRDWNGSFQVFFSQL